MLIAKYRRDRGERVNVNFDDSSRIGSDLREALRLGGDQGPQRALARFEQPRDDRAQLATVRGHGFARPRDEYWGNAAQRIKS